jgi:hypothetical protein
MSSIKSAGIEEHFAGLSDPRRRKVTYPLINVVTIALCAVICGADDIVSIVAWARMKREWLAKFLDLSSGVPSHDRFNAINTLLFRKRKKEAARNFIGRPRAKTAWLDKCLACGSSFSSTHPSRSPSLRRRTRPSPGPWS